MTRWRRGKGNSDIRLTPEGWVFLIVLGFITVGAVLRNVNLLIVMAGMMYAPLFLNWRFGMRRLKSLWAKRRVPNRLHANELMNIQWTCENRISGVATWNVIIEDQIERAPDAEQTLEPVDVESDRGGNWGLRGFTELVNRIRRKPKNANHSSAKLGFVQVSAGQSEVQAYRAFFGQRGKYSIGPATLSTTFPFGLIVSRTHFPDITTYHVSPELGRLEPTWERRIQSTAIGSDALKRRRALEEDEFYALRPWRSGDNKRNIHWRTTARYGQPIVKQYDQQNNRDFAMLLDLYASDGDELHAERCEKALSFAATVVLQLGHDIQGQVAVGVCGRETQIYRSRTPLGIISDLMRCLSVAHTTARPEIEDTLVPVFSYVSRGTPIYVVSSRERPEFLDSEKSPILNSTAAADRATRNLRQILPQIRWLSVESAEFENMFTTGQDPVRNASLKRLSSKWATNVKR